MAWAQAAKLAGQLAAAGITAPELVTADRLKLIDGVSGERADWLAAAFHDARPCYETAQLLAACRSGPVRPGQPWPCWAAAPRTSCARTRGGCWRCPDPAGSGGLVRPEAAARPGHAPGSWRGRALVSYLLARAARDGHTAVSPG